ncbi:MAG: hypothetical protein QM642_09440 [Edaphocola sp.]
MKTEQRKVGKEVQVRRTMKQYAVNGSERPSKDELAEQAHLAKLVSIHRNKKRGDMRTAAEVLGISLANAQRALDRIGSKYHYEVTEVLARTISDRAQLKQVLS